MNKVIKGFARNTNTQRNIKEEIWLLDIPTNNVPRETKKIVAKKEKTVSIISYIYNSNS